jgi:hypothetical protein
MLGGAAPDRRASGARGGCYKAPGSTDPGSPEVQVQMGASDTGQSSAAVAVRPGAEEEAGRRNEEHAARSDAGD